MQHFSTELISRYLDNDLSQQEQAEVEALLASNADARSFYEELRGLRLELRSLPQASMPGAPLAIDVSGSVLAKIQSAPAVDTSEHVSAAEKAIQAAQKDTSRSSAPVASVQAKAPKDQKLWSANSWPNAAAAAAVLLAAVTYMLAGPFQGENTTTTLNRNGENAVALKIADSADRSLKREFESIERLAEQQDSRLPLTEGKSGQLASGDQDGDSFAFADGAQQGQAQQNATSRGDSAAGTAGEGNAAQGDADDESIAGRSSRALGDGGVTADAGANRQGAPRGGAVRGQPETNDKAESDNKTEKDASAQGSALEKQQDGSNVATVDRSVTVVPGVSFGSQAGLELSLQPNAANLPIIEVLVDADAWADEAFRRFLEQQHIGWADTPRAETASNEDHLDADDQQLESRLRDENKNAQGLAGSQIDNSRSGGFRGGVGGRGRRGNDELQAQSRLADNSQSDAESEADSAAKLDNVQLVYVEAEPEQLHRVLLAMQSATPSFAAYKDFADSVLGTPFYGRGFRSYWYSNAPSEKYRELGIQIRDYIARQAGGKKETAANVPEAGPAVGNGLGGVGSGGGGLGGGGGNAANTIVQTNTPPGQASADGSADQDANSKGVGDDQANAAQGALGQQTGERPEQPPIATSQSGAFYRRLGRQEIESLSLGDVLGVQLAENADRENQAQSRARAQFFQPPVLQPHEGAQPPAREPGRDRSTADFDQYLKQLQALGGLQTDTPPRIGVLFILRKHVEEGPIRAPDPSGQ